MGKPVRAVVCWSQISGYMAACWRALVSRGDVELLVLARRAGSKDNLVAFSDELMRGVPCRLMAPDGAIDFAELRSAVLAHEPDVVVVSGWAEPAYVRLAQDPALARAGVVMAIDTPRTDSLRQRLGRLAYPRFFRRVDRVIVPGERSWQLARALGFPESKVRRGIYGIDFANFSDLHGARASDPAGWPRAFLYTGQYVERKGVSTMLRAFADYREGVARDGAGEPWTLLCCGQGPEKAAIAAAAGVEDLGFQQPAALRGVLRRAGCFVLASNFDPWPLVVSESCAAGLPVLCTEACGSAVELVRGYYNGLTVATGDHAALARGMRWIHDHHAQLPEMGRRSREFAAAYAAEVWAERWVRMFEELAAGR